MVPKAGFEFYIDLHLIPFVNVSNCNRSAVSSTHNVFIVIKTNWRLFGDAVYICI